MIYKKFLLIKLQRDGRHFDPSHATHTYIRIYINKRF